MSSWKDPLRGTMKPLSFFEWTTIWVAVIAICLALASKRHRYLPLEKAFCTDAAAVEPHLQDLVFKVPNVEITTGPQRLRFVSLGYGRLGGSVGWTQVYDDSGAVSSPGSGSFTIL